MKNAQTFLFRFFLVYLLFVQSSEFALAQNERYQGFLNDGIEAFNSSDYETAVNQFEAARLMTKPDTKELRDVNNWLERAKERRFNALKLAWAKADSALAVANNVLDKLYFYEGKFGLTLQNTGTENDPKYQYGYINKKGEEVIGFEFDEASPFSVWDGYARVKKDNRNYLLDTIGKVYLVANSVAALTNETLALDLASYNASQLPATLWNFPKLEILLIKNGRLTKLSAGIRRMKNLKTLDLSNNKLNVLPDELGTLGELQRLILNNNQLSTLPASLYELERLNELNLMNNLFTSLPKEIGNLETLRSLWLSNNELETLPAQISRLKQLKKLSLIGNQFQRLPVGILDIAQLEMLYLGNNKLSSLPENIHQLQSLKYINFYNNPIEKLPQNICNISEVVVNDRTLRQYYDSCGESFLNNSSERTLERFARRLFENKDFSRCYDLSRGIITKFPENYMNWYRHSWYALFVGEYKTSINAARKCLKIYPIETGVNTNLALGMILDDQYENAKSIYLKWKDKYFYQDNKLAKAIFLNDLAALESAGITHPDFDKVRKLLEN